MSTATGGAKRRLGAHDDGSHDRADSKHRRLDPPPRQGGQLDPLLQPRSGSPTAQERYEIPPMAQGGLAPPPGTFVHFISGGAVARALKDRYGNVPPSCQLALDFLIGKFGAPLTRAYVDAVLHMTFVNYSKQTSVQVAEMKRQIVDMLQQSPGKTMSRSAMTTRVKLDRVTKANVYEPAMGALIREGVVLVDKQDSIHPQLLLNPDAPPMRDQSWSLAHQAKITVRNWYREHSAVRPTGEQIHARLPATITEKTKPARIDVLVRGAIDARYGLLRSTPGRQRTVRVNRPPPAPIIESILKELKNAPGRGLTDAGISKLLERCGQGQSGQHASARLANTPYLILVKGQEAQDIIALQNAQGYEYAAPVRSNTGVYMERPIHDIPQSRRQRSEQEEHEALSSLLARIPAGTLFTPGIVKKNVGSISESSLHDFVREGHLETLTSNTYVTTGTLSDPDSQDMAQLHTDLAPNRPLDTRLLNSKNYIAQLEEHLRARRARLPVPITDLQDAQTILLVAKIKSELTAMACTSASAFRALAAHLDKHGWSSTLFMEAEVPNAALLCNGRHDLPLRPDVRPLPALDRQLAPSKYRQTFIDYIDRLNHWLHEHKAPGHFTVNTSGTLCATYSIQTEHLPYAPGEQTALRNQSYLCDAIRYLVNSPGYVTPEVQAQFGSPGGDGAAPQARSDVVVSGNGRLANERIAEVLGLDSRQAQRRTLPSGEVVLSWDNVDLNAQARTLVDQIRRDARTKRISGWAALDRRLTKLLSSSRGLQTCIGQTVTIRIPVNAKGQHGDTAALQVTRALNLVCADPPAGTRLPCAGCGTQESAHYAVGDATVIYPSALVATGDRPKLLALLNQASMGLNTSGTKDRRDSTSSAGSGSPVPATDDDDDDDDLTESTAASDDSPPVVETADPQDVFTDDGVDDGTADLDLGTQQLRLATDDGGRYPFYSERQGADLACGAHARNCALMGDPQRLMTLAQIIQAFPDRYANPWMYPLTALDRSSQGITLETLSFVMQNVDGLPVRRLSMMEMGARPSLDQRVTQALTEARSHTGGWVADVLASTRDTLRQRLSTATAAQRQSAGAAALEQLAATLGPDRWAMVIGTRGTATVRLQDVCGEAVAAMIDRGSDHFTKVAQAYRQSVLRAIDHVESAAMNAWNTLALAPPEARSQALQQAMATVVQSFQYTRVAGHDPFLRTQPDSIPLTEGLEQAIRATLQRNLRSIDNKQQLATALRDWAQLPDSQALIVQLRGRSGDDMHAVSHIVALRRDQLTQKIYVVDSLRRQQDELDTSNIDGFLRGATTLDILAFIGPEAEAHHPLLALTGIGGEEAVLTDSGRGHGVGPGAWYELEEAIRHHLRDGVSAASRDVLRNVEQRLQAVIDSPQLIRLYPGAARNGLAAIGALVSTLVPKSREQAAWRESMLAKLLVLQGKAGAA